MSAGGALPAGSSRGLRLDPFALPLRFAAQDARADGRMRVVDLTFDRIVIRRAVSGIPMAVSLPLTAYRGLALCRLPHDGRTAVVLEHRDPCLSVQLVACDDIQDACAESYDWARVLGLCLIDDSATMATRPVLLGRSAPRRRRANAIRWRRPCILMRRKPGFLRVVAVYQDEREIIARN